MVSGGAAPAAAAAAARQSRKKVNAADLKANLVRIDSAGRSGPIKELSGKSHQVEETSFCSISLLLPFHPT